MSARLHLSALLALLPYTACFNPTGQVDTTDATSSGPGTSTSLDPTTGPAGTTGGTTAGSSTGSSTVHGTDATGDPTTGGSVTCVDQPGPESFCSGLDLDKPFCDPQTKTCVECLENMHCLDPLRPSCNPETHVCGCTEHSDCPETACELDMGTCFPKEMTTVVHSKASQEALCLEMFGPTCNQDDPCCSIAAALTKAQMEGTTYIVVRVAPSTVKDTGVNFGLSTLGKRIAILGDGTPEVEKTTQDKEPVFFSSAKNKVYLADLHLSSATAGAGVSCVGADGMWADDIVVDGVVDGVGFFTAFCPLRVRRGLVLGSKAGVHVGQMGVARVTDTILAAPTDFVFKAEKGGSLDVAYTTALDRSGFESRLIQCFDTGMGTAFTARNSALFADPELGSTICDVAVVQSSVVTAMELLGSTVEQIPSSDVGSLFVDYVGNDLHVVNGAKVLNGYAVRQVGDSLTDIDRQPRPLGEGAVDWAGADRPSR